MSKFLISAIINQRVALDACRTPSVRVVMPNHPQLVHLKDEKAESNGKE